ncbi:hypothetical protein G4B88_008536 [Cannabis sativa]|uniref:Myosin motor domain-containing protein n=1 Tax=Cannabis sativa TaxID=3483 RepID=A0A7J6DQ50_CANSA|nr:hypothetical protein G4B88_008536 [Cannabis sativa]
MEAFAIDVLVLSGQCQWMFYSSDSLLTISLMTCSVNLRYLAFVGGRSATSFRILEAFGNAKTSRNNNSSDAHDYLTTKRDMEIIGISEKEQDAIFKVVAAILHLGNIKFSKREDNDSSCNPNALEDALCKRIMITPEEVIKRSLDLVGATGLAKIIYSRLFDW